MIQRMERFYDKGSIRDLTVSVIVLTYNHVNYICHALDSILTQDVNFRYEILIGDDASTDGTSDIVKEYEDRFSGIIKSFVRKNKIGPSRNAYETMLCAQGRYLASCEGDDYWINDHKLQIQVDFLNRNQQYSGCVHPVRLVDENGKSKPFQKLSWVSDKRIFSVSDFKGIVLPGHGVSMLRRNYLLQKDFDARIIYKANPHIADRTNVLIWLAKGPFFRLDETMACYRQIDNGSNLTSILYKRDPEYIKSDFKYTKTLENYAKNILLVDAGFQYHKRNLFVKSLLTVILHPIAADKQLVIQILKDAEKPLWYIRGILPVLLCKLISAFTKAIKIYINRNIV